MKILLAVGSLLVVLVAATSCTSLTFAVANAPSYFGSFSRRADVAYGTGPRAKLDVYTPDGAAARPIVVFWYGGAWQAGERSQYRFVGAALAEAGYVAVLPDYRLHPAARFPDFIDDGAAALSWVVSHAREIGGDPTRIFVAGHSAGAHLAAMLAYDRARLARHGISPAVIRGLIGLSGPYALNPDEPVYHAIFGAPYTIADWQPARLATPGGPAALLIHGDADTVVGVSHARAFEAALEAAAVPVTLRTYSGRGHRDTVAAFAPAARDKLPVVEEIRGFIGSVASKE